MKRTAPVIIALILVLAVVVTVILTRNDGPPAPDPRPRIALVAHDITGRFWQSLCRGANEAVRDVNFVVSCSEPSDLVPGRTCEQIIADYIAEGVAAVILASNQPDNITSAINRACDANIPCVVIGPHVENDRPLCTVGSDNYIIGLTAARRIARTLDGKGNLVVVKHVPGSAWASDRTNGFIDTIKREFPQMQLLDSKFALDSVETAAQAVEILLARHPEIHGLFACNESTTIGALNALRKSSRLGDMIVVGCGTESSLLDALKARTIDSLVAQDPKRMGLEAARAVLAAIEGRQVPKRINIELMLLTSNNIGSPKAQSLLTASPDDSRP